MVVSKVSDTTSLDHGERVSLSSLTEERASRGSMAERISQHSSSEVVVGDLIDISSDPGNGLTHIGVSLHVCTCCTLCLLAC